MESIAKRQDAKMAQDAALAWQTVQLITQGTSIALQGTNKAGQPRSFQQAFPAAARVLRVTERVTNSARNPYDRNDPNRPQWMVLRDQLCASMGVKKPNEFG